MGKGKVRMVFPGGNTCLGFYSFYDNIIEEDAARIFVIKGGPGVGKSTFMQRIGEEMQERGYDIEFHWCSSDNESLDAVVIPALRVALIDGTAPHVAVPVCERGFT
ncbi:MAG: ATPase [Firmicutes bacterium]|nr:ATPase [Bacillota bacterium]